MALFIPRSWARVHVTSTGRQDLTWKSGLSAPNLHDLVLVRPSRGPTGNPWIVADWSNHATHITYTHAYAHAYVHTPHHYCHNSIPAMSPPFIDFPLNVGEYSLLYIGLKGPAQLDPHLSFSFISYNFSPCPHMLCSYHAGLLSVTVNSHLLPATGPWHILSPPLWLLPYLLPGKLLLTLHSIA